MENQAATLLFDELRNSLGKVIVNAFDRTYKKHKIDYDPDTCYEAADDILGIILVAAIQVFKKDEK